MKLDYTFIYDEIFFVRCSYTWQKKSDRHLVKMPKWIIGGEMKIDEASIFFSILG